MTLSLISVLGCDGLRQMHQPRVSDQENTAMQRSVDALRAAPGVAARPTRRLPAPQGLYAGTDLARIVDAATGTTERAVGTASTPSKEGP